MFVTVQDRRLEYELTPGRVPGAATLVFLHEGLGSVALWRGFPDRVARATGCAVLAYSRYGYGQSDPLEAPRRVDFMHAEGLEALPELLDALAIERPVLVGHSDGASIALIHAGSGRRPVAGVVALAPHVFVEDVTIRSIEAAREAYRTTGLRERLRRYHADPDSAFRGWNDVWLAPAFRAWNIEEYLSTVTCPVLAIQGEDDEYGTLEQIRRIVGAAPRARSLVLPGCRHAPHRDRPDQVLGAICAFLDAL